MKTLQTKVGDLVLMVNMGPLQHPGRASFLRQYDSVIDTPLVQNWVCWLGLVIRHRPNTACDTLMLFADGTREYTRLTDVDKIISSRG